MDDVQRCHESLLRQRTQIRHHKTTRRWMKRCWLAAAHADSTVMTKDEYEDMYSILLYEMTICWEEELNEAILAKMWARDAGSHRELNLDRFSCSIFFFVEMWIEEITMDAYERVFRFVELVLLGKEHLAMPAADCSAPQQQPLFKPTLESFNNALRRVEQVVELQLVAGSAIS
ncbi:hypothetical protein P43SY_009146 [Pythium insidiosum]|uniref:Uncharacterized protein n=1 Tax=Pythium insidiosum TaxID=114742 RepID=A0AAD5Q9X1_PYTIN|nr:hypothetical protein P43SY_009146 [Pythium insidiosum]